MVSPIPRRQARLVDGRRSTRHVKYFLITYRLKDGAEDRRHRDIDAFIAALDSDPELGGKVSYLTMKRGGSQDYLHVAAAADEAAVKLLGSREFFSRYTDQTEATAEGEVEVTPLEIVAETSSPVSFARPVAR
jgi:hypothetical protein